MAGMEQASRKHCCNLVEAQVSKALHRISTNKRIETGPNTLALAEDEARWDWTGQPSSGGD
jgi:hypothetical protein